VFRDYCLRGVSGLLDQVQQDIQHRAASNLGSDTTMDTPLGELMNRHPLTCEAHVSVREAVATMQTRKVGSVLVTDSDERPQGIFTLHDLRSVVAEGSHLDESLAAVMTREPITLDTQTYAFEAVVEMARHRIRHMIVTDARGRLAGVLSERDIFALQRINLVHLTRSITGAADVDALVLARGQVGALIDSMMAHGAGVEQITRIITLLNDRTVTRAIELVLAERGDPGVAFTWIAFGSEGRREQTRVTDQDNGILFDPGRETPEAVRERLLPLARRINEVLDACGFALCTGNVMASNPGLCLSFEEWEATFGRLVASATPENVLNSTIYFDFRPVWGDLVSGEALQQRVVELAAGNSVFLHALAANALAIKPPLGVFRDFVTDRDVDGVHRLDLKVRGLTPFVDAARVLALQAGIADGHTQTRFRELVRAGVLTAEDAGAFERSFAFVQLLRMREHQQQSVTGDTMGNRLDPENVNPMDRRIMKEAFREARRLHKKLEVRFQL
jgi:CBS domain-containing protein